MNALKELYEKQVVPALTKKFEYKSTMQVPKLDKIVINIGLGDTRENPKALENAMRELTAKTDNKLDWALFSVVDAKTGAIVASATAPSFNPNGYPYIGVPGEEITLCNTLFTPKMIEIEMVDHDADTISYMLEGDQVRDRDNAIITTYNEDKEIYHQADYYTVKSRLGLPLYDVKQGRENIDTSQSYENIPKDRR